MDVQSAANLTIPEGSVRNIHDKDKRLLWSAVGYNVRYDGDTTQQTYSGKNLFNKNATVVASSWATTASPLTTGVRVTQLVSSIASDYRWVLYTVGNTSDYVGKTLTLYAKATASSTNKPRVLIGLCNADGSGVGGSVLGDDFPATVSKSITQSDADSKAKIFVAFYVSAGAVSPANAYVDYTDVQLEVGSTATSYEPYVGGVPAPNPDYPQDVNVVTGEQAVTVSGKNLIPITTNTLTKNGLTVTLTADGTMVVNGTSTAVTAFQFTSASQRVNLPAGTYTLSANNPVAGPNGSQIKISYQAGSSSPDISGAVANMTSVNATKTFTITEERPKVSVYARFASGVTLNNFKITPQLEQDSTATAYESHQSQTFTVDLGFIELCKIGNYQDYIYKSGDDWYVHKEIGKVVYNGSENWSFGTVSALRVLLDLETNMKPYTTNALCSHLVYGNTGSASQDNVFNIGGSKVFAKATAITTSAGSWKTWLATHNVSLYYQLTTSTDTEITDSTLIGQLNAVHDWLRRYDYYGVVSGNLPIIINRSGII